MSRAPVVTEVHFHPADDDGGWVNCLLDGRYKVEGNRAGPDHYVPGLEWTSRWWRVAGVPSKARPWICGTCHALVPAGQAEWFDRGRP